ncbi:MAG: methyltransferase domain-containing protein [Myxococcales bacterium]|nr:MAG: methyltransferase domain-containing protein [Myxococcales bacterium]
MSVDIRDRVYDAYEGELGQTLMRDTQRRIHWMCAAANGSSILDVGCSQGLIPILLAREGRSVVGIDHSASAIRSAEQHLASEPANVRKLVSFVEGDFASHPLPGMGFDCIVMGEVLEHLVQPERFVARAAEHLRPGGRMIVTVPFGINDHVDHKSTYYLLEPYRLLSSRFEVVEVTLLGKWLGLVAVRRDGEAADRGVWTDAQLAQLEAAFQRVERSLLDEVTSLRTKLDDANTKYRSSTEDVARLKREAAHQDAERRSAERERAALESQLGAVTAAPRMELEQLAAELDRQRSARHASELSHARLEERLAQFEHRQSLELQLKDASHRQVTVERDALLDEVRSLRAEVLAQGQQRSLAEAQLSEERQAHARATIDHAREASAAEAVQAALESARLEAEDLCEMHGRAVEAAEAHADRLAAELVLLRERSAVSQSRATALEAEVAALSAQIEQQARGAAESTALREERERFRTERDGALRRAEQQARSERELQERVRHLGEAKEALDRALTSQRILLRAAETKTEQLKKDAEAGRAAERRAKAALDAERKERTTAERRVVQTRNTLSFQLGYELIHGFKSRRALSELPKNLWHLQQEAQRRRRERSAKHQVPVRRMELEPQSSFSPAESDSPSAERPTASLVRTGGTTEHIVTTRDVTTLRAMRVACIQDEFTFASFTHECQLLQLTPGDWESELEAFEPDLLFVESAWRGKHDLWTRKVAHRGQELIDLVAWCRSRHVPTVFWNKEDPVHFRTFLNTAKLFELVFTTDIDCISAYKRALGHERVYLLPFAVQPRAHNPLEKYVRKDAVAFAGAYYARYPERQADLASFVDAFSDSPRLEIFDRNHGKSDPDYQFPERYRPHIVGTLPFDQIDKAYKGYRYALNLNSIKSSQTMFARRVFELLGSNTITVSNFSRGVRLLLGDLVVSSDNGARAADRLRRLTQDESTSRRFRLAGLRKVLREHTYEERLRFIASKVWERPVADTLPRVQVVARVTSGSQAQQVLASFDHQVYPHKRLTLLAPGPELVGPTRMDVSIITAPPESLSLQDLLEDGTHLAALSSRDHYGRNYLTDLALATLYSTASVIGKGARFRASGQSHVSLVQDGAQYRSTHGLPARASLIGRAALPTESAMAFLEQLEQRVLRGAELLAIDEFNYCEDAVALAVEARSLDFVDDLDGLDEGLPLAALVDAASRPAAEHERMRRPHIDAARLASLFRPAPGKPLALTLEGEHLLVHSSLPDETHEYLYAREAWHPRDLGLPEHGKLHFEAGPGLNVQLGVLFLGEDKSRLGHKLCQAGSNETITPPEGTKLVQLALRVYGAGSAKLSGVLLDHVKSTPEHVFGRGKHLLVTNRYPSDEDLYRNGFVHRRVMEYRRQGVPVDVFRIGSGDKLGYHEFDQVDVISGGTAALDALLRSNDYESIMVHFLDARMWQSLAPYLESRRLLIWAHGAEIQAWHRREAHYPTPAALAAARMEGEPRKRFWRDVMGKLQPGSKVIFVSEHFAREVMEDLELPLTAAQHEVIHNVIDTDLFGYVPKPAAQRKRILSIRPYTSRIYGNDLTVAAILALTGYSFFPELEFHLIGDGALFEETVAPLRQYPNVLLERRFLTQSQIAAHHKEYGVFLCPTRGDTQGVSRDEAMSSGLVPVTNAAGAIPEFVDADCGFIAPAEDALGLASAIARLYGDPASFLRLSEAAARRVRMQSGPERTTARELVLIRGQAP